jgi:hypothetical protein
MSNQEPEIASPTPAHAFSPLDWSTRQTGMVLGLSEASIKRLLVRGVLPSRGEPGPTWKVPAGAIAKHLRESSEGKSSLRESALAADDRGCLAEMIEQSLAGRSLGSIFDELATFRVPLRFIERAQPLAENADRTRRAKSAVVLDGEAVDSRMASCLLRASRYEVLASLAKMSDHAAAALALQVRPAWFWLGSGEAEMPELRAVAARIGCMLLRLGSTFLEDVSLHSFAHLQQLLRAG